MVKIMLQCYSQYYSLSNSLSNPPEKKITFCPSIQDSAEFFDSFDTAHINFNNQQKKGKQNSFSFRDAAHPPLKRDMVVTSLYGWRQSPLDPDKKKFHYGVDFRIKEGDTVYSVFCGLVRISKCDSEGYGKVVVIRNFNMSETLYAHLAQSFVNALQEVKAGDPIGIAGNTGSSSGPHLHFEIRSKGYPINPIKKGKLLQIFPVKKKSP
ncbi:MAG: M23 family metallopeptidase [Prevotellaceae bacterium]|jgi:murein DD-endopeptidase MepM/ murein hydrolase activator NlpD|nr:M23 family metallopeptidase [Prevotellaceae bacterium]